VRGALLGDAPRSFHIDTRVIDLRGVDANDASNSMIPGILKSGAFTHEQDTGISGLVCAFDVVAITEGARLLSGSGIM
jgi:hypothetical protein